MIRTSLAEELISGAPPAPGNRTFGFCVRAHNGRVDVREAIQLRSAEKSYINAPALQPVAEDLRRRHHCVCRLGQVAVPNRQRQHRGLRADRPRLVDQHHIRRVGQPREICRGRRQPDPHKAHGAVAQHARRSHRHHFVVRI